MNPLEQIRQRRQTGPVQAPQDARPQLTLLKGIRAVVFDIYGTLFSSGVGDISLATEEDRNDALQQTLLENRIQLTDTGRAARLDHRLHEHIRQHQSARKEDGIEYPEVEIRDVWRDFIVELKKNGWTQDASHADSSALAIDYETRVNPTQPMPGLEEALAALRGRGLVMSIVSNAQFYTTLLFDAFLGQSLETLGLCQDCAVWSYRLLEANPSAELYRQSAARLYKQYNILPKEVLYVGNDMRNDIWPAQETGYKTALFAGDRLSLRRRQEDPRCCNVQPDLEITGLQQLTDCV